MAMGDIITAPHNATREVVPALGPAGSMTQHAVSPLTTGDAARNVLEMTPEDQTKFLNEIDQAYPTLDLRNAVYVTALGDLCGTIHRLPTSAVVSAGLEKRGSLAAASGGFTDIWRGSLHGDRVAIKAFRIGPAKNLRNAKEILWKRVPSWKRLSHPNILPFRGVDMSLFQLSLIYDWGHCGNIMQYIASNPRASRPSLLFGVAKGLEYLHGLGIPHGGVKGANVVVDRRGRARLTEYGLAPINSDPRFITAATPGSVGISRWLAPEFATTPPNGDARPVTETKAADVFAFGMFAVEVFTGKVPFEDVRWDDAVVLHILRGGRPQMPKNAQAVGLTAEIWTLLESCWQQDPARRPTMEEVVNSWKEFVGHDEGLSVSAFPKELRPKVGPGDTIQRLAITEPPRSRPRPRTKSEVTGSHSISAVVNPGTGSSHGGPEPKHPHTVPTPPRRRHWVRRLFCGS